MSPEWNPWSPGSERPDLAGLLVALALLPGACAVAQRDPRATRVRLLREAGAPVMLRCGPGLD